MCSVVGGGNCWIHHKVALKSGEMPVGSESVGAPGNVNKYRWDRSTCFSMTKGQTEGKDRPGGGRGRVHPFILEVPAK